MTELKVGQKWTFSTGHNLVILKVYRDTAEYMYSWDRKILMGSRYALEAWLGAVGAVSHIIRPSLIWNSLND